jgi:hypothetical protein
VRLAELDRERTEILKAYPTLRAASHGQGAVSGPVTAQGSTPGRKLSAAARKAAVSEGMRRWWAARKGQEVGAASVAKPVRKKQFSAESRARLSRLAKERWARARKAGKTQLG